MANRNAKLIERTLKDFSLGVMEGGEGGVVKVDELPENPEPLTIYEITRVIPPAPTGMLSLAKAISKDFCILAMPRYAITSDSQVDMSQDCAWYYNIVNDTLIEVSDGNKIVTESEGNMGFFPSNGECIIKEVKGEDPSDPENKVIVVTLDGKEISIDLQEYINVEILKEVNGKTLIIENIAYQTKVVEDVQSEITAGYLINNELVYKYSSDTVNSLNDVAEQYIDNEGKCFALLSSGEIGFNSENYEFIDGSEEKYTGEFSSEDWKDVNDSDLGMGYEGPYPLEVRSTPKFCSSGEIYILDAPEPTPGPAPEPTIVTEHYIWQDNQWYNLDNLPSASATTPIYIGETKTITLDCEALLDFLMEKGVDVDAEMNMDNTDYNRIAIATEFVHMPSFWCNNLGIGGFLSSGEYHAEFGFIGNYKTYSRTITLSSQPTIKNFLSAVGTISYTVSQYDEHTVIPALGVMTDSEEDLHSYGLSNDEFLSFITIS